MPMLREEYACVVTAQALLARLKTTKTLLLWMVTLGLCIFYACSVSAQSRDTQTRVATIIFAADMPIIGDQNEGYPKLATTLASYRQSNNPTFFLFGGNSLGPSPMSTYDSGSHIVDLLNSLEPDAMGVTKREYSYFEEQLSLRAYEAVFPMVASNIYDPLNGSIQDGLVKSVLISRGKIKLGVLAVVNPAAKDQYLLERVTITNIESTLREQSSALRQKGADIVAVMHGNIFPEIEKLIVEGVIDVSLVKDRYSSVKPSLASPYDSRAVFLTEPGEIAVVNVSIEALKESEISWQRQSFIDLAQQPRVASLRDDYLNRLNRLMDLPLAKIESPFSTFREDVRTSESAFGNLVTDAMIDLTQSEVALINSGIIRGNRNYRAGEIFTRKNLATELPFRSGLVVLNISGYHLLNAIEKALNEYEFGKGKFPQVAGMKVRFDSTKAPGNRVISVTIDQALLDVNQNYKLATTDYLFNGGDGYTDFQNASLEEQYSEQKLTIAKVLSYKLSRDKIINISTQQRMVNEHE
ncbi:bifunctional metallophosphatase/5'-nucleotidase [Ningiella sp. W23]|uniref:bifunctional metallophosphatase/5'-nucleotidase n=1 Tax=Ningiella sp. W23 TaxID=3023715 RepID=UPI0037573CA7